MMCIEIWSIESTVISYFTNQSFDKNQVGLSRLSRFRACTATSTMKSEPEMERKGTPASPAVALARRVLLVPGCKCPASAQTEDKNQVSS